MCFLCENKCEYLELTPIQIKKRIKGKQGPLHLIWMQGAFRLEILKGDHVFGNT